jgi:thiamine-phosphate pyrophosphorylase
LTSGPPRPFRSTLADRRLYLCTPDRPDLVPFVDACIDGGVDVVQLREKLLDDRTLVQRGLLLARHCTERGVPFILNDRPDLAREIGADGVHVGQNDTSAVEARATVGDGAIVGLSTHSRPELDDAVGMISPEPAPGAPVRVHGDRHAPAPIDYVSAGPVVPTPTKPGRPGTGLGYVREAVRTSPWPVWITGGVDPGSVVPMLEAGARHFVVVRWLTQSDDPRSAARALRDVIDRWIETAGGLDAGVSR